MRFERILVAIDGSEFAAHALEVGSSLATAVGAQIGLVHVIDPEFVGPRSECRRSSSGPCFGPRASAFSKRPHPRFLRIHIAGSSRARALRGNPGRLQLRDALLPVRQ